MEFEYGNQVKSLLYRIFYHFEMPKCLT